MILAGRRVPWIITLIVVALAGLVGLQSFLLHHARELKEQTFRRNVLAALGDAVVRLEVNEVVGGIHFVAADSLSFIFASADTIRLSANLDSVVAHVVVADVDRQHATVRVTAGGRRNLVERVLKDLSIRDLQPLEDRLSIAHLDSMLGRSLADAGITTDFACGIIETDSGSLVLTSAPQHAEAMLRSPYRARLVLGGFLSPPSEVVLYFPDSRGLLWRQMAPLLAATIIFMLIVIGCFIYSIRTILAQRRFADGMIAFVNNMTHEFKTPISTVALASEALARPDVLSYPETVQRYRRMIVAENARMHQQVEKILQVASVERGDLELNLVALDLHEVLAGATAGFALQIESSGGRIETSSQASRSQVIGDVVHLTNVVHNLLDNAVKYSAEAPRIEITTRNEGGHIVLSVSDRGIGIEARDHERVFARYYRCDTGNRHDVKGFGLGLSYVRLIAEAHGGRVLLHSRSGRGTTVELTLPLAVEVSQ